MTVLTSSGGQDAVRGEARAYPSSAGIGDKIRKGETTLAELAEYAAQMGAPALPGSGRQEYLAGVVNNILFK